LLFAQVSPDHNHPILCFPPLLIGQHMPPHLVIVGWGLLKYLPRLA
jgi:hypothetical protein